MNSADRRNYRDASCWWAGFGIFFGILTFCFYTFSGEKGGEPVYKTKTIWTTENPDISDEELEQKMIEAFTAQYRAWKGNTTGDADDTYLFHMASAYRDIKGMYETEETVQTGVSMAKEKFGAYKFTLLIFGILMFFAIYCRIKASEMVWAVIERYKTNTELKKQQNKEIIKAINLYSEKYLNNK